jgi:hypothetical protein
MAELAAVGRVEILVLVDNVTDSLSSVPAHVALNTTPLRSFHGERNVPLLISWRRPWLTRLTHW